MRYDRPSQLPQSVKDRLLESLLPVAKSAFVQKITDVFCQDVENRVFSSAYLLVVLDENETPVAFSVWDHIIYDFVACTDILYLTGICVHKDWQYLGIGESLLRYVLDDDFRHRLPDKHAFAPLPPAPYVALRTQNALMKYCFDQATGAESYPRRNENAIPSDIKLVGEKISTHLNGDGFDSETLISRGLYGRCLYGESPNPPGHEYADLFSRLDIAQGDAMVCVWRRQTTH